MRTLGQLPEWFYGRPKCAGTCEGAEMTLTWCTLAQSVLGKHDSCRARVALATMRTVNSRGTLHLFAGYRQMCAITGVFLGLFGASLHGSDADAFGASNSTPLSDRENCCSLGYAVIGLVLILDRGIF